MKLPRPLLRRLGYGVVAVAAGAFVVAARGQATIGDAAAVDSLRDAYVPPEDSRDLLKLNDTMKRYFASRLTAPRESVRRLQQITDAVLKPDGLDFTYDVEGTFDPGETFRRRRGNCVGFAMLVVAVAREFGFTATFQNVDASDRWSRFGTIVVSVSHLNVRVETDDGLYLVDLRPDLLPSTRIEAMHPITDERAFSEFYGAIGLFRLVHGDSENARRWMVRATELDSSLASNWTNLANVYARLGDFAAARRCFERALRVDRNDLAAAAALLDILQHSGTPDDLKQAAKLERRAQAMRDRNPYWQERLAHLAEERGDWGEAEKYYRRAIALNDEELLFYGQWIAALRHLGRETEALRAERKLEKVRTHIAARSVHFGT